MPDVPPDDIIIDGGITVPKPPKSPKLPKPCNPKPPENPNGGDFEPEVKKEKIVVKLSNGRQLRVTDIEVRYVGEDGRPLTVSEFLDKLIQFLPSLFENEQQLRALWSKPETREDLLVKLGQLGFDDEQIATLQQLFEAEQSDIFDLLAFISYNKSLITRAERADATKKQNIFFEEYVNEKAQQFLYFVLERYKKDGIEELKRDKLSELIHLNGLGTTKDAAKVFGNANNLINAFYQLQEVMYKAG